MQLVSVSLRERSQVTNWPLHPEGLDSTSHVIEAIVSHRGRAPTQPELIHLKTLTAVLAGGHVELLALHRGMPDRRSVHHRADRLLH